MDFVQALKDRAAAGRFPVIPDIKLRSPGEGDLMGGRDPVVVAKQLAAAGAPALSVVTEPEHFGGSLDLLARVAEATGLPVLRKDFIQRPEQVAETAAAGGSAVLLIVSMLEPEQLARLFRAAGDNGLTALVETHNEAEVLLANALAPALLGINNRDILVLEQDDGGVGTTEALVRRVTGSPLVVSESAIHSEADVLRAKQAGAHAALVGTALLKAPDIGEAYDRLSVRC